MDGERRRIERLPDDHPDKQRLLDRLQARQGDACECHIGRRRYWLLVRNRVLFKHRHLDEISDHLRVNTSDNKVTVGEGFPPQWEGGEKLPIERLTLLDILTPPEHPLYDAQAKNQRADAWVTAMFAVASSNTTRNIIAAARLLSQRLYHSNIRIRIAEDENIYQSLITTVRKKDVRFVTSYQGKQVLELLEEARQRISDNLSTTNLKQKDKPYKPLSWHTCPRCLKRWSVKHPTR